MLPRIPDPDCIPSPVPTDGVALCPHSHPVPTLPSDGMSRCVLATDVVAPCACQVSFYLKTVLTWQKEGKHRRVFWLRGVLGIPRIDGFVRGHRDGRSIHRTAAYNAAAERLVVAAGLPVLDNFAPTRAFVALGTDPAHYTEAPIRTWLPDILVSQLLGALAPASPDEAHCRTTPANKGDDHKDV